MVMDHDISHLHRNNNHNNNCYYYYYYFHQCSFRQLPTCPSSHDISCSSGFSYFDHADSEKLMACSCAVVRQQPLKQQHPTPLLSWICALMMLTIPTETSFTASAVQVHGDVVAPVILQYLNLLILCACHNLTLRCLGTHE
jgi:hypothetical protein